MTKLSDDKRYRTRRWQKLRLQVFARDLYRCQVVAGCTAPVRAADHIEPVYEGMPDWEFYDPANLRASCLHHNTARGVAARLERETQGQVQRPTRYSYGRCAAQRVRVF